jgi:hypothetical protein
MNLLEGFLKEDYMKEGQLHEGIRFFRMMAACTSFVYGDLILKKPEEIY